MQGYLSCNRTRPSSNVKEGKSNQIERLRFGTIHVCWRRKQNRWREYVSPEHEAFPAKTTKQRVVYEGLFKLLRWCRSWKQPEQQETKFRHKFLKFKHPGEFLSWTIGIREWLIKKTAHLPHWSINHRLKVGWKQRASLAQRTRRRIESCLLFC